MPAVHLRGRSGRERQAADPRLFHRFGAVGNQFELCVNRVENGFFSNHLADLPDLPVGSAIRSTAAWAFVLQSPSRTQFSSPPAQASRPCAPSRSGSSRHGPDGATATDLAGLRHALRNRHVYTTKFVALENRVPNFHYSHTEPRAAEWNACADTCRNTSPKLSKTAPRARQPLPAPPSIRNSARRLKSTSHLHLRSQFMVSSVRERLDAFGWHKSKSSSSATTEIPLQIE